MYARSMPKAIKTPVKVKCPLCGEESEEFTANGLFGHLRFKHGLNGDKLDTTYHNGLDGTEKQLQQERKQVEKRALIDRVSELHEELRNVRGRLKQVQSEDESSSSWGFVTSDEAMKRLKRLYQSEEKRIGVELEELLGEVAAAALRVKGSPRNAPASVHVPPASAVRLQKKVRLF